VPECDPPLSCPGTPQLCNLMPGAELWRIHSTDRTATAMNPRAQPTARRGGRFDSLTGDYAYLYLGDSPEAAIAETLCRDLPLPGPGARLVPAAKLAGRVLSRVRVTAPIPLVTAHGGPALSQLGQDTWLNKCEPNKYVLTRRWAAAIAGWAPEAAGLAYRCRHDEDSLAWMLSTAPNRLEHPSLAVGGVRIALDEPLGRSLVRLVLTQFNAGLE